MKLGCIREGQESQPSIIALKFEVVVPGRDSHQQLIMITLFTRGVSYFTPHITTGFEPLLGSLAGEAGHAYSVING